MKKFLLTLTVFLIFSANLFAEDYNVNFKNVPMKDFITFVAEFTGKNLIFNESDIKGNVTVNTQKDMDAKEVLDIFYSVLKLNGYIPVVNGDNIQIILEKDVPLYDEDFDSTNGKKYSYVTTVLFLKHYNPAMLVPVLNKMKSRSGYIEALKGLNIIVARDQSSRIQKMMELISKVDNVANTYTFYTIPLQYTLASKLEQQLTKFYNELAKNSIVTLMPIIVSDDISNSLVVAATKKDYERIQAFIASTDSKNRLANTEPRVFYLKNSKAESVEKVLTKLLASLSSSTTTTNTAGINTKVSVSADNSTNTILAIGNKELYDKLESIIAKIDIPKRQVYVEALILETTLGKTSSFGVEWFAGGGVGSDSNGVGIVGSSMSATGGLGSLIGSISQGGTPALTSLATGGLGLGVIGNVISFQGARFPSIGALVNALKNTTGMNIVSNPQILTLDNSPAEVFVGENRPYQTSTKFDTNNNPIQTYDYRDVGVRLKVTPQISSNDMVTLEIDQEIKSIADSSIPTAPTTYNRTTKTTVKLQNHAIMVISGMIQDDSRTVERGIPGVSNIPILGHLFKTQAKDSTKTNVMLFITAHIIDTIDDSNKVLADKRKTMWKFNTEGDAMFSTGTFTDSGRAVKLRNDVDGLTEEEALKTQQERNEEKRKKLLKEQKAARDREKAEKKALKEREKELKRLEKEKEKQEKEAKKATLE